MPKQEEAPKKHLVLKAILLAVILLAMVLLLDWMHLKKTANSRYSELSNGARSVFLAAESYRAEGNVLPESGRIAGQEGFSGCLLAKAEKYVAEGDHYAIVCNEAGQIRYVLYAHGNIAEKYLNDPPQAGDGEDKDKMLRLLQTPVFWRGAVGVYYPAAISAAPAEVTATH